MDGFIAGKAQEVVVEVWGLEIGEVGSLEALDTLGVERCFEMLEGQCECEDVIVRCAGFGGISVSHVEAGSCVSERTGCCRGREACHVEEGGGLHGV